MLDVNWTATRPPLDAIDQLWSSKDFDVVDPDASGVERFVDAMNDTRASGDARWCCVHIPDSPALDWFAARNCLADAEFFGHLLASEAVTDRLGIEVPERPEPTFTVESGLALDGVLAEALVHGGSRSFDATVDQEYGTYAKAKRLARECCGEVIEDRYEEITIHRTREAWCDYFGEPQWNLTLVAVDRRYRWAWVLISTDDGGLEAAREQAAAGVN
jgi:hypothetical protein